ncbi:bifunctional glutamate N-acetyltransferase/amino-acid acetyltransferase ArgJ [Reinekea marina]|uniref:Arginine biosynthesis bifunctional protein ArgJ n=1 Tax=Reinekea marina TaxID=1310421 RepID=A0ABV7WQD4_9GAMM|nr:bifunctional glutamate N-acetyltransferase/amino-acid acetyltransferase ArgJ [Reinekea marina]MDN3650517.1 bifunctional glutamate N-acetyltransferase/amino-acid acetyltransferase ArgJ [Reinekea marina]
MAVGAGITDSLLPISGVSIGVACAGIKKKDHRDLVIFQLAPGSTIGAVFTQNAFCAAPVQVAKKHLASGQETRFLVVNTGNANAGTGQQGIEDAQETCSRLAGKRSVNPEQVLPFSTGVIGEYLPMASLIAGIPDALATLNSDNWTEASTGILTTDTREKGASRQFEFEDETITVTGIAKGSGMIKPNMATMLSFVATDAPISQPLLQKITAIASEQSFNRITVDSDTSTNDASVCVATGQVPVSPVESEDNPLYKYLLKTVSEVMLSLAQQIIRDGEGAHKFISVQVNSSDTPDNALKVAYAVAESPLFKTAMSASDANWGRILMAVGKSGIEGLDVDAIDVFLGDVQIVSQGQRCPEYTETAGAAAVAPDEITVRIELNRGHETETVWTTDLSYDYIKINAEYRS